MDIGQVLVVGPDHKGMFRPLKPVPPFLKGELHSQKLPVSDIIVAFSWSKTMGERTWVELLGQT